MEMRPYAALVYSKADEVSKLLRNRESTWDKRSLYDTE